jgi:hypothetical protein
MIEELTTRATQHGEGHSSCPLGSVTQGLQASSGIHRNRRGVNTSTWSVLMSGGCNEIAGEIITSRSVGHGIPYRLYLALQARSGHSYAVPSSLHRF